MKLEKLRDKVNYIEICYDCCKYYNFDWLYLRCVDGVFVFVEVQYGLFCKLKNGIS